MGVVYFAQMWEVGAIVSSISTGRLGYEANLSRSFSNVSSCLVSDILPVYLEMTISIHLAPCLVQTPHLKTRVSFPLWETFSFSLWVLCLSGNPVW